MTEIESMEKHYSDCDYLTGKNADGIRYDYCGDCYRYEICKDALEEKVRSHYRRETVLL